MFPSYRLSGTAGTGKSAIAITVATSCEDDVLVASFFFFRSDSKLNNPSALILTIAHGLVVNVSFVKGSINRRISSDPTILEVKLEEQFQELVLKPLAKRTWWRRVFDTISHQKKGPILVIIDGLDECNDEETNCTFSP